MHTHVTARRDEDGRWSLERDDERLVGVAGVDDEELLEVLADLIADGELEETDRIFVTDGSPAVPRRIEELLEGAGRPGLGLALAHVRAERYASVEHYV